MKSKFTLLLFAGLISQKSFAQNVGVGTNVPLSKISVNGNFSIGSSFLSQVAPSNGGIIQGQVGIGVSSPSSMLQVGNVPNNLWGVHITTTDVVGGTLPMVVEQNTTGRTFANIAGFPNTFGRLIRLADSRLVSGAGSYYDFGIDQNGSFFITDRSYTASGALPPNKVITINSQDFVGINMGTGLATNPTAYLHLNCSNVSNGLRLENLISASGTASNLLQKDANGYISSLNSGTTGQILSQGASGLTWTSPQNWLLTGNAGTNATVNFIGTIDNVDWVMKTNNIERARITSSGRFGVNTASPMSKLALVDRFDGNFNTLNCCSDLAGFSIFDNSDFVGITTIDRDGNLGTIDDADGMIYWGDNPDDQDLFFTNLVWNGTGLVRGDRMIIKGDGRVGIGTNAPSQLFHVFNGTTNGTYTTSGWVHSSDKRLKTNIQNIESPMNIVNNLKGVWYEWKNNKEAGRQVGFLAQDVQKILPEVVVGIEGEIEKGETLGMAYQNIVPILVEALKEKDKEISELRSRVENIENQLNLQKK